MQPGLPGGPAGQDSSGLFKPYQLTKSPLIASGLDKLGKQWAAGANGIPGFDELKNAATQGAGILRNAFSREQQSFDLGPYAANQRAADAAASGLTEDYANTARGIGRDYANSDAEYARQMRDIITRANAGLGDFDTAANRVGDQQTSEMMRWIARGAMGSPAGVNSGQLQDIARGVADVRLPLEREKINQRYNILSGLESPAYRDIATRNASRYAGFDLPLEQNIYGQRVGDVMRSKQTESQLKQLEMSVAGMSRAAAESYLRSMALPQEIIQSVLQRHNQTLAGEIANLGGLSNLEDQAYWRGLEYTPGMNLSQSRYFSNSLPIG